MAGEPKNLGLLASAKGFASTLLAIVHTRVALFATELREEIEHARTSAILALVAVVCFSFSALLLTLLVVVAFWETHRLLSLAVMSGLYFVAGSAAVFIVRDRIRNRPLPFAASLGELSRDREQLER